MMGRVVLHPELVQHHDTNSKFRVENHWLSSMTVAAVENKTLREAAGSRCPPRHVEHRAAIVICGFGRIVKGEEMCWRALGSAGPGTLGMRTSWTVQDARSSSPTRAVGASKQDLHRLRYGLTDRTRKTTSARAESHAEHVLWGESAASAHSLSIAKLGRCGEGGCAGFDFDGRERRPLLMFRMMLMLSPTVWNRLGRV